MNNIDVTEIYKKIDFVERYTKLCQKYNDFDNALEGNNYKEYGEIIEKIGYKAKYFKGERFYRIEQNINSIIFGLQLTLKNGMVEVMLDTFFNEVWCIPDGRIDFMCEEIDTKFNRQECNLLDYTSFSELEEILTDLFSIYEDFKKEFMKQYG